MCTLIQLCYLALTMVEILRISFLICLCLDLKRLLSSKRLIIWQVPLLNLAKIIHQFFKSYRQLQYCSLLRFLYLVMSFPFSLMLLWVMYPSVKKFCISKAFSFSLFFIIFIGPLSRFLVSKVVGDPFSKMHNSGIMNLIFRVNLSIKQKSQRKGTRNYYFLPLVSSDSWSVNDTCFIILFQFITIFWHRWHRHPQLFSSCTILWATWQLGQSSFIMFLSCIMCLLKILYINDTNNNQYNITPSNNKIGLGGK